MSRKRKLGVTNFAPMGRSCPCLYVVTLKDQPGVVKVGRSVRWSSRRRQYADWNLADGDGIASEHVFEINEEWVDLEALEAEVIGRMIGGFKIRKGREWFHADAEGAVKLVDRVLTEGDVCFTYWEA